MSIPLPSDPVQLGLLAGHFTMSKLVAEIAAVAQESRQNLKDFINTSSRRFVSEWKREIDEIRRGEVDASQRGIQGSAFRPNYHARQASDHFEAERWTESFMRFVMAGEVLLGSILVRELAQREGLQVEAARPGWFSAFTRWAREHQPWFLERGEFLSFTDVYKLRGEKVAHGHEEATLSEAVAARIAYQGLQVVVDELGALFDIRIEEVQRRALAHRSRQPDERDVELATTISETVRQLNADAKSRARVVLDRLDEPPAYPTALAEALAGLSAEGRDAANRAMESAMQKDLDLLKRMWSAATDAERAFNEVLSALEDEAYPS